MNYQKINEGEYFTINDIKSMPKLKTGNGYIDLRSQEEVLDTDIPKAFKKDFVYTVITEEMALALVAKYENN